MKTCFIHIYNQLVGEFKPFGCCLSIQLFLSRISSFDFLHPCYFSSMLFPKVWWGIRGEGAFPFPIPPKLKGQFAFAQGYSVRWKWKLKERKITHLNKNQYLFLLYVYTMGFHILITELAYLQSSVQQYLLTNHKVKISDLTANYIYKQLGRLLIIVWW